MPKPRCRCVVQDSVAIDVIASNPGHVGRIKPRCLEAEMFGHGEVPMYSSMTGLEGKLRRVCNIRRVRGWESHGRFVTCQALPLMPCSSGSPCRACRKPQLSRPRTLALCRAATERRKLLSSSPRAGHQGSADPSQGWSPEGLPGQASASTDCSGEVGRTLRVAAVAAGKKRARGELRGSHELRDETAKEPRGGSRTG